MLRQLRLQRGKTQTDSNLNWGWLGVK